MSQPIEKKIVTLFHPVPALRPDEFMSSLSDALQDFILNDLVNIVFTYIELEECAYCKVFTDCYDVIMRCGNLGHNQAWVTNVIGKRVCYDCGLKLEDAKAGLMLDQAFALRMKTLI